MSRYPELPQFRPETLRAYRLACAREQLERSYQLPAYEQPTPRVSNRFLKGFVFVVATGLVGQVFVAWAMARLVWR